MINILFVTGVYYPEINGASLQARLLIQSFHSRPEVKFFVLAGYSTPELPKISRIDRTLIARIHNSNLFLVGLLVDLISFFHLGFYLTRRADIVHFHGFSLRNGLLLLLCKYMKKATVLKMTSVGVDDPLSVKRSSSIRWALFKQFDFFIGLTPAFESSFRQSGLDTHKYRQISNGVDMRRFSQISTIEKRVARQQLSLPPDEVLVISVGHFSSGKNQLFSYTVWAEARRRGLTSKLIFIGANRDAPGVDNSLLFKIQDVARREDLGKDLIFIHHTNKIEKYLQAADIYLSPSMFEGLSNALLEALAVGLPCLVSRLPDNTTWLQEKIALLTLAKLECPEQWTQEILKSKNNFFFSSDMNCLQFSRFREEFDIKNATDKLYQVYEELSRNSTDNQRLFL
jgi:glycosyltransferase involved in cell wall biosynthesis